MRKIRYYVIPILLCFFVGFIASRLQAPSLESWYPYLTKPALTPPDSAFPIAWNILYVLMGISIGMILSTGDPRRNHMLSLFLGQLMFNFGWSLVFFYLQSPVGGLVVILILELLLIVYAVKAWSISKGASILFWPYIAWVGFATYLNFSIMLNN